MWRDGQNWPPRGPKKEKNLRLRQLTRPSKPAETVVYHDPRIVSLRLKYFTKLYAIYS